jgi:hypothetical protein
MKVGRRIFAFWLGDAPMDEVRSASLRSLRADCGVEVLLLGERDLGDWILPEAPLHPAYRYLAPIHKADYLRAYFMHHHGGGYSDIKPTSGGWSESFDLLDREGLLGVGSMERGSSGVVNLYAEAGSPGFPLLRPEWWKTAFLKLNYRSVLGVCAFILAPRTEFTARWFSEVERRLDAYLPELELHPGRRAKERKGRSYGGEVSLYPVMWSSILGDIFQPLSFEYRRRLGNALPRPIMKRDIRGFLEERGLLARAQETQPC